jgi:CubicO group peptidase (beta-lactamase class C family)
VLDLDAPVRALVPELELPMAGPLRGQWLYTNLGYALAGEALGRAAGLPWEELLATRVLTPLGMTRSSGAAVGDTDRACGHVLREGRPVVTPHHALNAVAPAGQLVAPASDAARWLLLQCGEELLPQRAVRRTHEPQIALDQVLPFPEIELDGYALGWIEGSFRGRPMSWHSGGVDGFMTQTLVLPEQRIGILLSATSHLSPFAFAGALTLADSLLGEADGEWFSRLKPPPEQPAPRPRQVPAGDLTGRWSHPAYGVLSVAADGSVALGDADLAVTACQGRRQLHYPPLDLTLDVTTEEDAVVLPLDPETEPVRFRKAT